MIFLCIDFGASVLTTHIIPPVPKTHAHMYGGEKVKCDVFGERVLLSFHDCTLEVETIRYLDKAHGIVIISKSILFLDEYFQYKNQRYNL